MGGHRLRGANGELPALLPLLGVYWAETGKYMGQKLKIAGWVGVGVVAGALTTVSLQTVDRKSVV